MPTDPIEIDCQAVQEKLTAKSDEFLLLDCREPNEHDLVHLGEATLLPMSQLMGRVGELDAFREKEIVVMCHHGMRSMEVARWLGSQGFSDVKSMSGGIDQWALQIDTTLARY